MQRECAKALITSLLILQRYIIETTNAATLRQENILFSVSNFSERETCLRQYRDVKTFFNWHRSEQIERNYLRDNCRFYWISVET